MCRKTGIFYWGPQVCGISAPYRSQSSSPYAVALSDKCERQDRENRANYDWASLSCTALICCLRRGFGINLSRSHSASRSHSRSPSFLRLAHCFRLHLLMAAPSKLNYAKRIVILCDGIVFCCRVLCYSCLLFAGTWADRNSDSKATVIQKINKMIPRGENITFYQEGVGTSIGMVEKLIGGEHASLVTLMSIY